MGNCALIAIDIPTAALYVAILTLIVAIATLIVTVRNSKGHIHKQIDKYKARIEQLEHKKALRYRYRRRIYNETTPEDEKIERLRVKIAKLERKL